MLKAERRTWIGSRLRVWPTARGDGKLAFVTIVAYCFAAIRLAGSPRDQSSPPSTVSRASLRRAVPSFMVEVRRRPRLATNPSPEELRSSETQTRRRHRPEASSHCLAAVTFGAAEAPNQSSGEGAASPQRRRMALSHPASKGCFKALDRSPKLLDLLDQVPAQRRVMTSKTGWCDNAVRQDLRRWWRGRARASHWTFLLPSSKI